MSSKIRSSVAFTLLEVMIVLAIIAIVMGLTASRVNKSADRNLRTSANHISTVVRYLYHRSVVEGLYLRLVLDFDSETYWVQSSADPVVISRDDFSSRSKSTEKKNNEKQKENENEKEEQSAETKEGEGVVEKEGEKQELVRLKPPKDNFSTDDSNLLKITKLPDVVFFKDVWTENRDFPVESGRAYIHFFPNGYVEHAMINLRDKADEKIYSIEIKPLSGAVDIIREYRRLEKD